MRDTPGGRRRWWPRTRKIPASIRRPVEPARADDPTAAGSLRLAVGLITASLDSPELEAWAARTLIPEDPKAVGGLLAGLHLVSLLLLQQLQEETGRPPLTTLQQLAILAEAGP